MCEHPPEVKAAVLAALLAGQGVTEIAREHDLPKGTVGRWKAELASERSTDHSGDRGTEKRQRIEELVIEYLTESLETLSAQVRHARSPEWIERQSASDLAVFHGVVADKQFRILAALEPREPEPTEP